MSVTVTWQQQQHDQQQLVALQLQQQSTNSTQSSRLTKHSQQHICYTAVVVVRRAGDRAAWHLFATIGITTSSGCPQIML
jgi:hypothetical protein